MSGTGWIGANAYIHAYRQVARAGAVPASEAAQGGGPAAIDTAASAPRTQGAVMQRMLEAQAATAVAVAKQEQLMKQMMERMVAQQAKTSSSSRPRKRVSCNRQPAASRRLATPPGYGARSRV